MELLANRSGVIEPGANCVEVIVPLASISPVILPVGTELAIEARIAYGVEVIACRGASEVNAPDLLVAIEIWSHRGDPLKALVPKSRETVNNPSVTGTAVAWSVEPI